MQIMQSEIDNIMKGIVVQTPDYISNKRVIGIGQSTVIDQNGQCAPLSKQSAFLNSLEENVQSEVTFNNDLNTLNVNAETSVGSTELNPSIPELQPEIETPVYVDNLDSKIINQSSDVINEPILSDTPVSINNPDGLENLLGDIPNIGDKVDTLISKTIDSQMSPYNGELNSEIMEPVTLPKLDEPSVAAVDPTQIKDSLFNDKVEQISQSNDTINEPMSVVTPTIVNDDIIPETQPIGDFNQIEEIPSFKSEELSTNVNTSTINDSLLSDNIGQTLSSNEITNELDSMSIPKATEPLEPVISSGIVSNDISNNNLSNAVLNAFEKKKQDISLKIANYMTAASTMLLDEILELIKEEILNTTNTINSEKNSISDQVFSVPSETSTIDMQEPQSMTLNI